MNMSIALQRPPYKGKLNFDEETYLGVIAFGNALGNSIVGHIQERENLQKLQNKLSQAFTRTSEQGAIDLDVPEFVNVTLSDPQERAVNDRGGINVDQANAFRGVVNNAQTGFDNFAAESSTNRTARRNQLSALRDRRLGLGNARAAASFDALRPTGFNGTFTEAEWLATINNKTMGEWRSDLTRDVLTVVGGLAAAPFVGAGAVGLGAWGVRGIAAGGRAVGAFATDVSTLGWRSAYTLRAESITAYGAEAALGVMDIVAPGSGMALPIGGGFALAARNTDELANISYRLSASNRSANFQGISPYEGIDTLRNIELGSGKRLAHVTFTDNGRPISEYFTTESAIRRVTLTDGSIDANKLNQGLQIYAGVDPITGIQRSNFKPMVQMFETTSPIPFGQAAFGRAVANPHLNPSGANTLPQVFINENFHQYLQPLEIRNMVNTTTPFYKF